MCIRDRAGAAGGGGAAADVSRSLAGWLKGGSRGVGDNISPPKAASGGGVVSPSAVSPSATACALVAADAAPSAARLADDAVEGGGNSGSFGQSGTPPASSGTRAPRRSARASVSSMIGGLMASFAIGDRAPRPSGPSDSDSAARTDDDEESDGDDEHNVCIFLSQVGYDARHAAPRRAARRAARRSRAPARAAPRARAGTRPSSCRQASWRYSRARAK